MPSFRGVSHIAAVTIWAAAALAQTTSTGTATPAATSSDSTASITSATSSTSTDVPLALWSDAQSLLSSYYPSSSITNLASITWPTVVVIDSQTYTISPTSSPSSVSATSTSSSVLSTPTSTTTSDNKNAPHRLSADEKTGIIIGVVLGSIAFGILATIFYCLWRRKQTSGSFFLRRPTPSIADSEMDHYRTPQQVEAMSSPAWVDRYNHLPAHTTPPMAMHPAYARQYSNQTSSEENPFYTPEETPSGLYAEHNRDLGPYSTKEYISSDMAATKAPYRGSAGSLLHYNQNESSRSLTPFLHSLMMGGGTHHAEPERNPFVSPEDEEAQDLVSPIIPPKSPERRNSPQVHYPSWTEVSEFDFTGSGSSNGPSLRGQSSAEDGEDGWHAARQSVAGRHELA